MVKYFIDSITNSLFLFFSLFDKVDEKGYYHKRDELLKSIGDNDFEKDELRNGGYTILWSTVLSEVSLNVKDINSIYRIKETFDVPPIRAKMEYFLKNKFWGLLNYYNTFTDDWSDSDFFDTPGLNIYLVNLKNGANKILILRVVNGKLFLINNFKYDWLKPQLFSERTLIYNEQNGFIGL